MTERHNVTDPAQLLTAAEAAALLNVSGRTFDRYQARGLITPLRTPGGHRRYAREQVAQLLPTASASA